MCALWILRSNIIGIISIFLIPKIFVVNKSLHLTINLGELWIISAHNYTIRNKPLEVIGFKSNSFEEVTHFLFNFFLSKTQKFIRQNQRLTFSFF